ncbi:MAG: hypothetical protein ACKVRN_06665 [Pyrinomonadaceae bacterium]
MNMYSSRKLLFTITVTLAVAVAGYPQYSQSKLEVPSSEYEVFSAYIDQLYLRPDPIWFDLSGNSLVNKYRVPSIGQVVVGDMTVVIDPAYYPFAKEVSDSVPVYLLNELLRKNVEFHKLRNLFSTGVKTDLWIQDLEEQRQITPEAEKRKISWEQSFYDYFFGKYPQSIGYIFFSRPAFGADGKSALLRASQSDYYSSNPHNRSYPQRIVLFEKEKDRWLIKNVFPQENLYEINLIKCKQVPWSMPWALGSMHLQVDGLTDDRCKLNITYEQEMGYSSTVCKVPTSLHQLIVKLGGLQFIFAKDISKFCEKPKSGNLIFDQIKRSTNPKVK